MNGDNGTSTQAPQMRALLFTDLCDSLILVERIGDAAAAELFQEHDRLVLVLQQQWNGRLIDRSDGLLLLFERAIDGLGFALDYQRGLLEIGKQRDIVLRARAGLHVGEVLTWENSPEAIKVGAKSLEVEGLAKPMAARLMTLARPGQILLSAVAESLTHRAVGELGERGERLVWKSHGGWRFKGMPGRQDIHEVGERDFAPLRAPRGSPKARRAVPLWRRPMTLLAEVALVAGMVFGTWAFLRPTPAIAFGERDWVVLGNLHNLTGNALLDDSLQQAFRISLEQSRYVNVLSDMKVQETLERMRREGGALDRDAAIEVALREGARAVIVPTVAEVHGRLRVSLELIDPNTGNTAWSDHADGRGMESLLGSTDDVVAQMRAELGEAMHDISRDSMPLPKVATASLDALHAYAMGVKAYGDGRYDDAQRFFGQAVRFDPDFAFAYLAQLRIQWGWGNPEGARQSLAAAKRAAGRLSGRDRLYMDAWDADLNGAGTLATAEKWKLLGDLYPDYHGAHANYAWSMLSVGRYSESEQAARKAAVAQNPLQAMALQALGRAELAQNHADAALRSYRQSARIGQWSVNRHMVAALAAHGDLVGAQRMLAAARKDDLAMHLEGTAVALDAGEPAAALRANAAALRHCGDNARICGMFQAQSLSLASIAVRKAGAHEYEQLIATMIAQAADPAAGERGEWLYMAAASAYLAQRAELYDVARRQLPHLQRLAKALDDPRGTQMVAVLVANQDRVDGRAAESVQRLRTLIDGGELFQVHVALQDSLVAAGDQVAAAAEQRWLATQRGRAYAENAGSYLLQALNVHDSRAAQRRLDATSLQ